VPGWPFQRPAGGIQSPYFHRASGLAQIAVSTLLRNSSSGNRKFLHAEHCRYGTRDLALIGGWISSYHCFVSREMVVALIDISGEPSFLLENQNEF
jgi:hypothetical protein